MRFEVRKFFKGEDRTVKAKKNIFVSFFLKGIDAIVYLLLVPVTLGYLNEYEYGIWLTLNSILMWINSLDIGLGNGLRNRLTSCISKGNRRLGRIYVSTTFVMLVIIMIIFISIGILLEPLINWYAILNTSFKYVHDLNEIVFVSFLIFCLNFIFKFIGNVYQALQLPAINNLMVVGGHAISLIIIYLLTLTTSGSLLLVAVAYTASPLIIYLLAYPITFFKVVPYLRPSIDYFKKEYLKDLFNLGLQFFLIQLSAILLFAFSNLLISHMFGPEEVTPYNISYRYFSLIPMGTSLIIAPLWSATTDAYERGDMDWIRKTMKSIHKVLMFITIIVIIMILLSQYVYTIWIGKDIEIPFKLSIFMGIYVLILVYSMTYSNFLNGLGKLRIQSINTVIVAILFVPLCYYWGLKFRVMGIVMGMCILNISGLILNYIQFNKLISNRAVGIWNK